MTWVRFTPTGKRTAITPPSLCMQILGAHEGSDCVVVEPPVNGVQLFIVSEEKWVDCDVILAHYCEVELS